jgi:hypothetical protein
MFKRKCNLLAVLLTIIELVLSGLFISIVESIKPLKDLLFLPQFIIFGVIFIVIMPSGCVFTSNLYLFITGHKKWFQWFKISSAFDGIFNIVALCPAFFMMFELVIFLGYYQLFTIKNEILGVLILGIPCALFYSLSETLVRKVFEMDYY